MSEEAKAPEAPKKSFAEFLATVPEAPSSSKDQPTEAAAEPEAAAEDPKADAASAGVQKPAGTASSPGSKSPPAAASTADGVASPSTAPSHETDPVEAIRAALRAGDLDALAEAVGEDPALYSEKSTKWAAARRKEQKLKAERDRVAQQAEAIVKRTQPVFDLAGQVQQGDFAKVPELIEYLTGVDYDALVLKVARARHGSDPQVEVLKRRVAELEPVVAERESAKATAAERALLETLRDEVAAEHAVRQFEGWEARVAAVLRESVDEDLGEPTLSVRQAADRVLRREREEFERRAKVFGAASAPAKPKAARAPERASGAVGAPKRKLTRDEWLAQQK